MSLRRYWITFAIALDEPHPPGVLLGCGVTAFNDVDALQLVRERVFKSHALPPIRSLIEDVDISILDANHVLPNMDLPTVRGIWFPRGYN